MRETSERRTWGKAGIGLGVLVLAVAAAGGFKLASHESKLDTQVLGASSKATPAPTITSGPSGSTSSTSATFKYSDSEKGVTFKCALDDAPLASCPSSGMTYTGLPDASYRFTVAAQGVSQSPPTSRSWTVDTVAPATSITDKPENPTIETSARFSFNSETGVRFRVPARRR